MEHYKYVKNEKCEYFPCHAGAEDETFNCLFCYCPLYPLGERCGGNYIYTAEGIKDCSGCAVPHIPGGYERVIAKFPEIAELARKKPTD